jgi:hypothetical protein
MGDKLHRDVHTAMSARSDGGFGATAHPSAASRPPSPTARNAAPRWLDVVLRPAFAPQPESAAAAAIHLNEGA